jgi:hypothetical protein
MFLNIPLIADWHTITERREHFIHENVMGENQKKGARITLPSKWCLRKNGSPKIGQKNKWSIQNSISPCQWDSDHSTETRSHRKNQYKANQTIQAMINYQILMPPTSLVM